MVLLSAQLRSDPYVLNDCVVEDRVSSLFWKERSFTRTNAWIESCPSCSCSELRVYLPLHKQGVHCSLRIDDNCRGGGFLALHLHEVVLWLVAIGSSSNSTSSAYIVPLLTEPLLAINFIVQQAVSKVILKKQKQNWASEYLLYRKISAPPTQSHAGDVFVQSLPSSTLTHSSSPSQHGIPLQGWCQAQAHTHRWLRPAILG